MARCDVRAAALAKAAVQSAQARGAQGGDWVRRSERSPKKTPARQREEWRSLSSGSLASGRAATAAVEGDSEGARGADAEQAVAEQAPTKSGLGEAPAAGATPSWG